MATVDSVPLQDHEKYPELVAAAVALHDVVSMHLEHEESLLVSAITAHVSDCSWTEFFRSILASAPQAGAHLGLAVFEEALTPSELALITAHLPKSALRQVPAMRERATNRLKSLRAGLAP